MKLFLSAIELFFNFMCLIPLEKLHHMVHRLTTKNHKENEFIIKKTTGFGNKLISRLKLYLKGTKKRGKKIEPTVRRCSPKYVFLKIS